MNINIRGELYDLSSSKVMGILNLTPDSFYDGGKYNNVDDISNQISKMVEDGLDILDIGGYSSRPGAKNISSDEEKSRVLPVLKHIKKKFPQLVISIDTFRSEIAEACLSEGADIINDISSGIIDKEMMKTISKFNCPYIMMHMLGNPQNMQDSPKYKDVVIEVIKFLSQRIKIARDFGIVDLITDPGFGFGKTTENNFEILNT